MADKAKKEEPAQDDGTIHIKGVETFRRVVCLSSLIFTLVSIGILALHP